MPIKQKKAFYIQYLPWLLLAAAWLAAVAFQWKYGSRYLDSDMASEMVLANLLNKEGGILSVNWYYSTELRVCCQQLLFKVALWLLPQNWHAARTLAQAVLLSMLAASALYLFKGAGLHRGGVYLTAAMLCPFGFWYMFHGVFGGFYFVHIIFVQLSLGLVLRVAKSGGRQRTLLRLVLLAVLCFAAGLNGLRLLMSLYVPLLLAAVLLLLARLHMAPLGGKPLQLPEMRLFSAAAVAAVFSVVGYLINSRVLALTHHFAAQEDRMWSPLSIGALLDSWGGFFSLFGYPVDSAMYEIGGGVANVALFSAVGLLSACGLLLAAGVAASAVRLTWRWRRLNALQRTLLALFWCTLLVDGIAFSWLSGTQTVNASYWLPTVSTAFALLGIEAQTEHFRLPQAKSLLAGLFCLCVVGCSAATTLHFLQTPPRANLNLPVVEQWLVQNGYTKGYATFWNANVMTEQTNGQLEVWDVNDLTDLTLHSWLQSTAHEQPPEGRVFVLVRNGEADLADLPYAAADGSDVVYSDANFTILGYESATQILALVGVE